MTGVAKRDIIAQKLEGRYKGLEVAPVKTQTI